MAPAPQTHPGDTLGLYISIPFCRAKCSFCNFASGVSSTASIDAYITKLCAEIDLAHTTASNLNAHLPHTVDTVYFGGGTPSLLTPTQLDRIFTALHRNFTLTPAAEITLEAAPGQITDEVLTAAQSLGVNRISLGVQSFIDRESQAVGRSHTGQSCIDEILRLQTFGIPELCADLIAGLPYQTPTSWQHSLETATSIGLTHLSIYMLEVDVDSRLGNEILAGGKRFHAHATPADDLSAELYETACTWLPTHGFPQYEISNFAAPAHHSHHNRKYWHRAPYLGFGLDAHSMLLRNNGALRFANPDDLPAYTVTPNRTITVVDTPAAFEETLFLGLRLTEGISLPQLRADFPPYLVTPALEAAQDLIREGLLTQSNDRLHLTLRGRMISNDVFTHLLSAVAA
jgi:oxygen-independent coproporphyrinogen-3 oxidase